MIYDDDRVVQYWNLQDWSVTTHLVDSLPQLYVALPRGFGCQARTVRCAVVKFEHVR